MRIRNQVRALVVVAALGGMASFATPAAGFEYTVYDYDHAVWRVGEDGSGAIPLIPATRDYPARDNYKFPALSPDGQRVAYTDGWNIYLVDINGQAARTIFTARYWGYVNEKNQKPQFGPDGQKLIFEREVSGETNSRDIYSMSIYAPDRADPVITWPGRQYEPTYSSDGSLIAFTSATTPSGTALSQPQLFVANADGSNPRQLTTSSKSLGEVFRPRFSADDSKIAFWSLIPASGKTPMHSAVFTIAPTGTGLTKLTTATASGSEPEWTSDGRISYAGGGGYSKMNADGTGNTLWLSPGTLAQYPWGNLSFRKRRRPNDPATLLERYAPELRYDSQEQYFAGSAAMMTDNAANTLMREDGTVLATPGAATGAQLSLGFLTWPTYPSGLVSEYTDKIDAGADLATDAQRMQADWRYRDQIYARLKHDAAGKTWLQYWFFYYHNPWNVQGQGDHEGDWEMIQIGLKADNTPDVLTYAQHEDGDAEACSWFEVETALTPNGEVPVVYPARGSHASYTAAGDHNLLSYAVQDHADGLGPAVQPTPIVITDSSPSWVNWQGRWGGTPPFELNGKGGSPRGPSEQGGGKWTAPDAFHNQAGSCEALGAGAAAGASVARAASPPVPTIHAHASGKSVAVAYRVRLGLGKRREPRKLLVTVHPMDKTLAPSARTVRIRSRNGTVSVPTPYGSGPYTVRASTFTKKDARSRVAHTRAR